MDKLKVLLVGCGNIAGKFDMNQDSMGFPYTHAGAYRVDGRFSIEACVDPDGKKRDEFKAYWGIPKGYESISQLRDCSGEFDVVSICSPTKCHKEDVLNAINLKPKLIFCEKPITPSADESKFVVDKCKEKGILLAINHTRRWDPKINELKADIDNSSRGVLRQVIATYNKGVLNNGSHLIDLLGYLFGGLFVESTLDRVFDYSDDDPSVPMLLKTATGLPIHCAVGHAEDFALFELQFIFSSGILSMKDGGLYWDLRSQVKSDSFTGYKVLDKGEHIEGGYKFAMSRSVDNIYQAINNNLELASNGESAYRAQVLCEQIKLS